MTGYSFYSAILGLSSDWRISDVTVGTPTENVEIHIVSTSNFHCNVCGVTIMPSGFRKSRWLHHNRFNIRFYITALIPLVTCQCCGEIKIKVPWEQSSLRCDDDWMETVA